MKLPVLALALLAAGASRAAEAGEPGFVPETQAPLVRRSGGFNLELLPKPFQTNPRIEMTVYSERTPWGREQPDVSPSTPAYYVMQSQGYQPMGSNPVRENPPPKEVIDELMQRVLEARGFLPVRDPTKTPTLAIIYYWGSHSGLDVQDVMENPALMDLRNRDILQRAMLVGGRGNAAKYSRQIAYGVPLSERQAREEHLRYQIHNNLYYVVVSAYDYESLSLGQRRLVWRTTMTVNDRGLNMDETLPPLIVSATDFFGRDTGETMALERRINRRSVTLGPLMIIGVASPPIMGTPPPPAEPPAESK
ncbi:MAG TPA: hypothetical protein VG734_00760 [Lacunisphaera sp.]|nr:hypothetical protein [Lacunisphaera sp.]